LPLPPHRLASRAGGRGLRRFCVPPSPQTQKQTGGRAGLLAARGRKAGRARSLRSLSGRRVRRPPASPGSHSRPAAYRLRMHRARAAPRPPAPPARFWQGEKKNRSNPEKETWRPSSSTTPPARAASYASCRSKREPDVKKPTAAVAEAPAANMEKPTAAVATRTPRHAPPARAASYASCGEKPTAAVEKPTAAVMEAQAADLEKPTAAVDARTPPAPRAIEGSSQGKHRETPSTTSSSRRLGTNESPKKREKPLTQGRKSAKH
jgi:hypothetical protein